MTLRSILIAALMPLLALGNMAARADGLSGSYVADSRPAELLLFTLIQSGDRVSGSVVSARPDGHGGTASSTRELDGTASGEAVVLNARGGPLFNGRLRRGKLSMSYATASGSMATLDLVPGSEAKFNTILAQWQRELAAFEHETQGRQASRQALDRLGDAVAADIEDMRRSGLRRAMASVEDSLRQQRGDVESLRGDLAALRREAAVRPMTCSQAFGSVGSAFKGAMGSSFNGTLGSTLAEFGRRVGEVEARSKNGGALLAKFGADEAKLAQATSGPGFQLSKPPPADRGEVVAGYKAARAEAAEALPKWRAASARLVEEARGLMREGQAATAAAQQSVRCPQ